MNTLDWFFIACFGFSCMAVGCSLGSILVLRQVEKIPKPKELHELSDDEVHQVLIEAETEYGRRMFEGISSSNERQKAFAFAQSEAHPS